MSIHATEPSFAGDRYQRGASVLRFFALVFGISWMGALIVFSPSLLRGRALPKSAGLLVFPAMLLGPLLGGLLMTRFVRGRAGLRDLFLRMRRVRLRPIWYAALLLPPTLVYAVLRLLSDVFTPAFVPNWFPIGISFGIVAGFAEEVGWTGYAFPAMVEIQSPLSAALQLGVLWAIWHIPAIDYLGTATPHRSSWLAFFLAFTVVMVAMRVLICWTYVNTESVLLAQLMHASSTGALVMLSPIHTTGMQEAFWYGVYGVALWIFVAALVMTRGRDLKHRSSQ